MTVYVLIVALNIHSLYANVTDCLKKGMEEKSKGLKFSCNAYHVN